MWLKGPILQKADSSLGAPLALLCLLSLHFHWFPPFHQYLDSFFLQILIVVLTDPIFSSTYQPPLFYFSIFFYLARISCPFLPSCSSCVQHPISTHFCHSLTCKYMGLFSSWKCLVKNFKSQGLSSLLSLVWIGKWPFIISQDWIEQQRLGVEFSLLWWTHGSRKRCDMINVAVFASDSC